MAGIYLNDIAAPKKEEVKSGKASALMNLLNRDIRLGSKGISDQKKERFYSEMCVLLSAKVDIHSSLQIVADHFEKTKIHILLLNLCDEVIKGATLSGAMQKGKVFSEYEFRSVYIGEETGRLEEVLHQMAAYYAGRVKQRRQVINVISYPLIVLCTAMGAVFFMLQFVVPMFADVFKRFNSELPGMTLMILNASKMVSVIWLPAIILLISGVVLIYKNRHKNRFRDYSSRVLLKIPVLKDLILAIYLARFSQSMSLLLGSRIPLDNALSMVIKMVEFYPLEIALTKIREEVLSGESLYKSMSRSRLFSKKFTSLVRVAEEVNQMDLIFEKLAHQYNEEAQHRISIVNNLLEPLIIIGLGCFVTIILIAMYLPLFRLSSSFGL